MTNKQLRAKTNAKVDDALRKLNRETERRESKENLLFNVVVWTVTAVALFRVIMDYLEKHTHLMGTPNP